MSHRHDHHRRHRRPHLPGARRRLRAQVARRAGVLARHERRHGVAARSEARGRFRRHRLFQRARQGMEALAVRTVCDRERVPAGVTGHRAQAAGRRRRVRRVRLVSGCIDGCRTQPAARHPQPRRACGTCQSRTEARRGSRAHRIPRRARRRTQSARRMGRQSVAGRTSKPFRRPSSASPAAAGRCVCS